MQVVLRGDVRAWNTGETGEGEEHWIILGRLFWYITSFRRICIALDLNVQTPLGYRTRSIVSAIG